MNRRSIIGGSSVRELDEHINPDGFKVGLTRQEVQRTERATRSGAAPTSSKAILTEVEEALLDVMRRRSVASDEDEIVVDAADVAEKMSFPTSSNSPKKPPRPSAPKPASSDAIRDDDNNNNNNNSPPEVFLSDFHRNSFAEMTIPFGRNSISEGPALGSTSVLPSSGAQAQQQQQITPISRHQQQQNLLSTFANASDTSVPSRSFGASHVVFDRTFDNPTYTRSAVTGRIREGPSQPQSLSALECDELIELLMFCTDLFKHDLFTLLELFSTPFEETTAVDRFAKKWEHVLSSLSASLFPSGSSSNRTAPNSISESSQHMMSKLSTSVKNTDKKDKNNKEARRKTSVTNNTGHSTTTTSPPDATESLTFTSKLLGHIGPSATDITGQKYFSTSFNNDTDNNNVSIGLNSSGALVGAVAAAGSTPQTATKAKEMHTKFSFLEGLKGMLRSTFQYTFEEVALRHQEKYQNSFSHKSYNDAMFSAIGQTTKATQHSLKMEARNKLLLSQLEASQKEVQQLKEQRDLNTQQYFKELMQVRQKMVELQKQAGDNTKVAELLEHPSRMRSTSTDERRDDDDEPLNIEQHLRYINKKLTVECAILNHTLTQRDHVLRGLERELEQSRAAVAKAKILASEALLKDEAVDATLEEAGHLMTVIDELKTKIESLMTENSEKDQLVKDAEAKMLSAKANFAMLEIELETFKKESIESEAQLKSEVEKLTQQYEDIRAEGNKNLVAVEAQLAKQRQLLSEERRDHHDEMEQNYKQQTELTAALEKAKAQLIEEKQTAMRDIAAKDVLIAERDKLIVKLQLDVDQQHSDPGDGNLTYLGDDSRPASATIGRRTLSQYSTSTEAAADQALRERNELEKIAYASEQTTTLLASLNDLEVEHHQLQSKLDLEKSKWAAAESEHNMTRKHLEQKLLCLQGYVGDLEEIISKYGGEAAKELAIAAKKNRDATDAMRRNFEEEKSALEDENDLQMKELLAAKKAQSKASSSERIQRLSIQAEARLSPFGAFLPMEHSHSGRKNIPRPLSGSLNGSPRASWKAGGFNGEGSRADSETEDELHSATTATKPKETVVFLSTTAFSGGSSSSHQYACQTVDVATSTEDFVEYLEQSDLSYPNLGAKVVRTQSVSSTTPNKKNSKKHSDSIGGGGKSNRMRQLEVVAGGNNSGDAYLIAQLRQEVERLRKLISSGHTSSGGELSRQSSTVKSHARSHDAGAGESNVTFQQRQSISSTLKRNSRVSAQQRASMKNNSVTTILGIGNSLSPQSPALPILLPGSHPLMDAPIHITSFQSPIENNHQTSTPSASNNSPTQGRQFAEDAESPTSIPSDNSRSATPSFPLTSVQTQLFNSSQPLPPSSTKIPQEKVALSLPQADDAETARDALENIDGGCVSSQNAKNLLQNSDDHPDVPTVSNGTRIARASSPKGPRGSAAHHGDSKEEPVPIVVSATVSRGAVPASTYVATSNLSNNESQALKNDRALTSASTSTFATVLPVQLLTINKKVAVETDTLRRPTDDFVSMRMTPSKAPLSINPLSQQEGGKVQQPRLTPTWEEESLVQRHRPNTASTVNILRGLPSHQSSHQGQAMVAQKTDSTAPLQITTSNSITSRPHSASVSKLQLIPTVRPGSSAASRFQSASNASSITSEFPGLECAAEHYDLFECVAKLKFAMNELISVCEADILARQQQAIGDPEAVTAEDTEQFVRNQMLAKFNIFRNLDNCSTNLMNKLEKKKENILRRREDQLEGVLGALQNISLTHPKEAKVLRGKLNGRRSEGASGVNGSTRVPLPMTQMELLPKPRPNSALDMSSGGANRSKAGSSSHRSLTPINSPPPNRKRII